VGKKPGDVTPPSRDAELTCVDQFFAPAFYRLPSHLWREARDRVFARDDFTCVYCGDRGGKLECDHIVPVARGGSDVDENLATACLSCNRSKRDMLVSEWRQ
jgi:5-methylcytosine-specific restriction endonuclease McrA